MNRLQFAVVVLIALTAGIAGGWLSSRFGESEPVHAQAIRTPGIRVALLDLVKVSRSSAKYAAKKIEFDKQVQALRASMEEKQKELANLEKDLKQAKSRNAEAQEIQRKEIEVKAMEEEMKVIEDYYRQSLTDLSNDFQKVVLVEVYEEAKKYCISNGYDMMLQQYDLTATSGDDPMQANRAWAETLKNMPVLYAAPNEPGQSGKPNIFVQDITQAVIDRVK